MTTYCDVNTCEDCPRYGDDCDGDKRVEHTDLISRADAVNAVHKYFVDKIDNEPHEIDEDGDDVFTDMKSVNALFHHNKMVSKAIKALPSADAVSQGRLIDADSLISDLEEWKENPNNDDSAVDLVNHFIGIIRATPSANAVSRDVYDKRTKADEEIIDSYRQEFQKALSAVAVQTEPPTIPCFTESTEAYKAWTGEEMGKTGYEINEMNKEIIKDILKMMPTAYLLEALGVDTVDELMKPADAVNTEKLKGMKFVAIKGDKTEEAYRAGWNGAIDCVIENVLSSADAVQGEWVIEDAHTEHCSVCGYAFHTSALFAVGGNDEPNFCPNCGARMKGGDDE